MTKPKPEWYKSAYSKLYGFLRTKHPEVLEEYRAYLKMVKQRLEQAYLCLEEKAEVSE